MARQVVLLLGVLIVLVSELYCTKEIKKHPNKYVDDTSIQDAAEPKLKPHHEGESLQDLHLNNPSSTPLIVSARQNNIVKPVTGKFYRTYPNFSSGSRIGYSRYPQMYYNRNFDHPWGAKGCTYFKNVYKREIPQQGIRNTAEPSTSIDASVTHKLRKRRGLAVLLDTCCGHNDEVVAYDVLHSIDCATYSDYLDTACSMYTDVRRKRNSSPQEKRFAHSKDNAPEFTKNHDMPVYGDRIGNFLPTLRKRREFSNDNLFYTGRLNNRDNENHIENNYHSGFMRQHRFEFTPEQGMVVAPRMMAELRGKREIVSRDKPGNLPVHSCWRVVGYEVYYCSVCPTVCTKDGLTYVSTQQDIGTTDIKNVPT